MAGAATLASAETQVERELARLGIGGSGFTPGDVGVQLNELADDTDANAYLFAVRAARVLTASEAAGTSGAWTSSCSSCSTRSPRT